MAEVDSTSAGVWQPEVEEIAARRARGLGMGGPERIAKQHQRGKNDVRGRIDVLIDPGTFREIGALTGTVDEATGELGSQFIPSNAVIGNGDIGGVKVALAADDFTVGNGAPDEAGSAKRNFIEGYATEMRMPIVRLIDMAGASLSSLKKRGYTMLPGSSWDWLTPLSEVPVVSVAVGPAPGLGAWRVAASHFSIQVRGTGQVFAAGPPIVEAGMRQKFTAEELGGADVHAGRSGVVDNAAETEEDAFDQVRRFLSYLPSSVHDIADRGDVVDDPQRRDERLLSAIPRNVRSIYKVRPIIESVFDTDSVFEIGAGWGRSAVVGFARLDGYPVGFIANDPRFYGGGMDEMAAEKLLRHIDLCETFHLPIVNLADQPGTVIGLEAEQRATVRKGLRVLAAIEQATVPWFTVVVRRLFGVGGAAYGPTKRLNNRVSWPSARWGSMPVEGGVDALYRREFEAAENPDELRAQLEAEYSALGSPLRTAERFGINDVIDPRDTRTMLCEWIHSAWRVLEPGKTQRGLRP